ncbi:MAG: serine hydrolase [Bacteroidales bacterium]|nr:serine hydrolase [Bacteroidales bacterium]
MKTTTLIFSLFAAILTGNSCCLADELKDITTNDTVKQELQSLVEAELSSYKAKVPTYPGGLALKVITGDASYFATAGLAAGVNENIHFRAASNTKTITSAAILLLYERGKLKLTDCLTDTIPGTTMTYLPRTPEYDIANNDKITILDLLRHRAGVFDVSNDAIPDTIPADVPYKGKNYLGYVMESDSLHTFTFDELIGVNAATGLSYFAPGTGYHYSNTGYSILGKIIERVSQVSYQKFVTDNILTAMGMYGSSMPVLGTDRAMPQPFVPGYVMYEGKITDVSASNISANVAEGTLITTPLELASFLRRLLKGEGPLSLQTINEIMMNYVPTNNVDAGGYGCGLSYTNNLGYGHTGAHEGYLSLMAYDPDHDISIVLFTNVWNLNDGMESLFYQLNNMLESTAFKAKTILLKSKTKI